MIGPSGDLLYPHALMCQQCPYDLVVSKLRCDVQRDVAVRPLHVAGGLVRVHVLLREELLYYPEVVAARGGK